MVPRPEEGRGAWPAPGRRRHPALGDHPRGKIEELIIAWDPGQRFAFTATAVSPGIVRALLDDCRIERTRSGTRATYTIYLDPVAPLRPIMKLMKGLIGKQLDKGMRALTARAEGR